MTETEIRTAFLRVLGCEPRAADLGALMLLGTEPEDVAEYLWDHWLGEPDEPSFEQVLAIVQQKGEAS